MKHIIVALVVVALIISLGITEQVFINTTFDEIIEMNKDVRSLLESDERGAALAKADEMIGRWFDKVDYLELMFPHNEFKDFIILLSELKGSITSDQLDDAIAKTYVVESDAVNRRDIVSYRLKNVL